MYLNNQFMMDSVCIININKKTLIELIFRY